MSPFASLYRLRVGDWGWWDGKEDVSFFFGLVGAAARQPLERRNVGFLVGGETLPFRQVVAAALMYCMDYEI